MPNNSLSKLSNSVLSKARDIFNVLGCVPVNSASIRVTSRCQARCSFCSSNSSGDTNAVDASTEIIQGWVEQIYRLGAQYLFITGGEPTLRHDIGQIVKGAKDLGFEVALSTNGLGLDREKVVILKDSGLKHIQISMHGTRQEHDKLVGVDNAYGSAMKAISMSLRHIDRISIAMTITKDNIDEVENVTEEALSAGAHWIALHPVMITGRAKPQCMPSIKEVLNRLNNLKEVYRKNVAIMLPPALVPSWARNEPFGKGYVCTFPDMIAVDEKGTVAPCDGLLTEKDWQLGNLNDNSLTDILSSVKSSKWRALRDDPTHKLKGVCRKCRFLDLCCGGCRALSFRRYNRWNAPDIWCEEVFNTGAFPEESLKRA